MRVTNGLVLFVTLNQSAELLSIYSVTGAMLSIRIQLIKNYTVS